MVKNYLHQGLFRP